MRFWNRQQVLMVFLWILGISEIASVSSSSEKRENQVEKYRRFKRNAPDNIQTLLDLTSPLARISTAITLQSGIISESIPIYDAISELLNFGTFKVKDVLAFKPDSINALAVKLLDSSLDSSQETIDSENQALKLNEMRKTIQGVPELKITPEATEYFTKVQQFGSGFNFSRLEEVVTEFNAIKNLLDDVQKIPETNDGKEDYQQMADASTFTSLNSKHLNNFNKTKSKLEGVSSELKSYNVLMPGKNSLGSFVTVVNLMRTREKTKKLSDKMKSNFESLLNLHVLSKAATDDLNFVGNFMKFRVNPHSNPRKHAPGFPQGLSDMDSLRRDIVDKSVENQLNGTLQKLAEGLKPLLGAQYKMGNLFKSLESLNGFHSSVTSIEFVQSELSQVAYTKDDVAKVLDVYDGFVEIPETVYAPVDELITQSEALSTVISKLEKWVSHLLSEDFKKAVDEFKVELKFSDWKDMNKISDEVPMVRKNLRGTKALEKFKNTIAVTIAMLPDTSNLTETVNSIVQTPLDTFLGSSEVTAELENQKNLRGLGDNAEQVSLGIHLIRNLRELKKNEKRVQDLRTVASTIVDSSGELKKLGGVILKEMKSTNTSESKALAQMKNGFESFHVIGNAVLGIQRIQDFRKSMESIRMADASVKRELSDPKYDSNLKSHIEKDWGSLKTLEDSQKAIEGINGKLAISKPNDPSYLATLLQKFEVIGDVAFDGKSKMKALNTLQLSTNDPNMVKSGKEAVKKMDSLDLQFSNHKKSFSSAPDAMKKFQDLLTSFMNTSISKKNDNTSDSSGEEEQSWFRKNAIYIIIFMIIVLLIAGALFYYCCDGNKRIAGWVNKKNETSNGSMMCPPVPPVPASTRDPGPNVEPAKVVKPKEEKSQVSAEANQKEKTVEKQAEKPLEKKEEVKNEKSAEQPKEVPKKEPVVEVKVEAKKPKKKAKKRSKSADSKEKKELPLVVDAADAKGEALSKKDDIKPEECLKWAKSELDKEPKDLYLIANGALSAVKHPEGLEQKALTVLPKDKHRDIHKSPYNPNNPVPSNNTKVVYHATFIPTRENNKAIIVAQSPLSANPELGHSDTREDFLSMVMGTESNVIVMIGQFEENGKEMSAVYFSAELGEMKIGRYTVKTTEVERGFTNEIGVEEVTRRTLSIIDNVDNKTKHIQHYQYHAWPSMGIPTFSPATLYQLSEHVFSGDNSAIVHSPLGYRALGFALIRLGTEYVENDPESAFNCILTWARKFRWGAMLTVRQFLYVTLCISYNIYTKYGSPKDEPSGQELWADFEKWYNVVQDMNMNIPEAEKGRKKDQDGNPEPDPNGLVVYY
ncbi:unnamed protein product [Caenorhabditis nigoni]